MLKQRKIPLRMCVGCRERKPKREMLRVVRSPEGAVSLDRTGKAPGRGAYVCPDPACMRRAMKSRALDREFEVKVEPEIYEALAAQMEADG